MKIQLFNPPVFHYAGFHYRMLPPLGLPILSAVLNAAGHETEVVDLEALRISPTDLKEAFEKQKDNWPDVVGLTSLTVTVQGVRESIEALRAAGFTGRIIVGGVHPTTLPDEAKSWGADLVVTGECEGNIVELVESGADGIQAGLPMPIEDIPAPDWINHSPKIDTYIGNMGIIQPNPGISMWTRGCPYQCIFCSNVVFSPKPTKYRPPKNIEAEMIELKRLGIKKALIYDDELVGTKMPPGWMSDVADRVAPLDIPWVTQGRCSGRFITAELMADVKRAGCMAIFWGVESFSDKVLKAIKKHTTAKEIWHTLRVSREAGIDNGVFTMIGNYTETEDDLELTCNELARAYKEGIIQYRQTTFCTAMEGTEYKRIQEREGWYKEVAHGGREMMSNHHGAGFHHHSTPLLSSDRIDYWMARFNDVCPAAVP